VSDWPRIGPHAVCHRRAAICAQHRRVHSRCDSQSRGRDEAALRCVYRTGVGPEALTGSRA
jgi:hypothetical protein